MNRLSELTTDQKIDELKALFEAYGNHKYTDVCSKQSHMEQCATIGMQQGDDEDMQLAAFLHDIGHLLAEMNQLDGRDELGFHKHSEIGADYLAELGFSARIVRLVGMHVQAKRYLAATDQNYMKQLSPASLATLIQQGGPMRADEAETFEHCADCEDLVHLRQLDDLGKKPDMAVKGLDYWLELARRHLGKSPA